MDRRSGDRSYNPCTRKTSSSGASAPFVGRDSEIRRLTTSLNLAAEGQGGVVFLTGQPGIGKTRLVREALSLARERGFIVLEGRALPLEGELAYAPVLSAFSPLLRSLDPAHLAILVDGLPDLGCLFGGLNLPQPEPLGNPSLEKTRLFEAVSRLLERLAQEAPVVLFIDDLQWADSATLDLLHYLARGLSELRTLLLATYNENISNISEGLQALVGSLGRDGLAEEIVLPRLDPEAVDELVQGILGGKAPGNLLALLDVRAAGTPLFVEALITALIDAGHLARVPIEDGGWILDSEGAIALPPTVRRLILRRLRRLAQSDRRTLDLIAILGDATSYVTLRLASGMEEDSLLESLRRLGAAGLVAESADGLDVAYGITHPIVREVVYAELPEIERRRAHLAAIKALESFSEDRQVNVNRLARHYQGAGSEADPGRAIEALLAAGGRALGLYANEEAARYYSAALAILREGGGEPDSNLHSQLSTLLERLGEAWERIGKRGAAVDVWNQALAERERSGDILAVSRLRRQLALAEWDRGHFDISKTHLAAGLALLRDRLASHGPCLELADLLFARFELLSRVCDVAGIAATAAELLSLSVKLGWPRAEAEANLVVSISSQWQNDITNARERALRALMIAEQGQELAISCRAHAVLASIGIREGDHHSIRYHCERGLAAAHRLGAPNMEVLLRSRLAQANFLSGSWEDSLRNGNEAIALARRVGHPRDLAYALGIRAMVAALQGYLAEAEECICEAKAAFGTKFGGTRVDSLVFGYIYIAEVALALEQGQGERALEIAKGFAMPWRSAVPPQGLERDYAGLNVWLIPMGLILLAEAQVAASEPDKALETACSLNAMGPVGSPYLTALASRAEGLARQALGQGEAAMVSLTRAHKLFAELEMPFEAAKCLLEQANLTVAERPKTAARVAKQSLGLFERLDAQRHAERARQLLQGLEIKPLSCRRARIGGVSLSEREIEIARLVAAGLTTPEIARRLTLSRFTVNSHLQHIYSRLGIGSRTALARLVIEAGFLSPTDQIKMINQYS